MNMIFMKPECDGTFIQDYTYKGEYLWICNDYKARFYCDKCNQYFCAPEIDKQYINIPHDRYWGHRS